MKIKFKKFYFSIVKSKTEEYTTIDIELRFYKRWNCYRIVISKKATTFREKLEASGKELANIFKKER